MLTNKIVVNWALSHDTNTDWDIGYIWITEQDIKPISWRKLGKFNQWNHQESVYVCTLVWATREYCYQNNIEFSDSLMLDVINYAVKNYWYKIWDWWASFRGMDAVRKYFGNIANYVKISYNDSLIANIYSKWNVLWITYRGNNERNIDSDDWELSWNRYEPTTYWHRTTTEYNLEKKQILVNDSYDWSKWNIYSIPHIIELVNTVNVYPTFYYWIHKVRNETEVKDLYSIIQWYDWIIETMMIQYRLLKKENEDDRRKKLLKFVWEIRKEKEKYIELLKNTQR
jgi:hypothetical protein